jgi:hypothetical protein
MLEVLTDHGDGLALRLRRLGGRGRGDEGGGGESWKGKATHD